MSTDEAILILDLLNGRRQATEIPPESMPIRLGNMLLEDAGMRGLDPTGGEPAQEVPDLPVLKLAARVINLRPTEACALYVAAYSWWNCHKSSAAEEALRVDLENLALHFNIVD